jgi:tRNA A37 threonylcarbamoyladenosine biosynthesis protein TsaE
LCVLAIACGIHAGATAAEPPAAAAPGSHVVSVAGGKLRFALKDMEARPVPGQDLSTMYFNGLSNQAVIVTEGQLLGASGVKPDAAFRVAVDTLKEKQRAASPNYRIVGEGTTRVKGLDVYRLDGTDDLNGMKLLMATLMVADNQRVTIIEVMSDASDAAGHRATVETILGK